MYHLGLMSGIIVYFLDQCDMCYISVHSYCKVITYLDSLCNLFRPLRDQVTIGPFHI